MKRKLRQSLKVLSGLENLMKQSGVSRQERRTLWRHVASSEEDRERVIKRLAKGGRVDI